MNKLALIRYGDHENGHLNELGIQTMILVSKKLKSFVQNKNTCIISAKVTRAIESAKIISKNLNISPVQIFEELYAAPEDGVKVNLGTAMKVIETLRKDSEVIIAVVSREYIETLPNYILNTLGAKKVNKIELNRGEILVLDYDKKNIAILN